MIATAERLRELRVLTRRPVVYPSAEFEASRNALAAAVPELLDTIESLCRVIAPTLEEEVQK